MAGMNTLADLFQDELPRRLRRRKRVSRLCPKMAKAASDEQLRDAFTTHLEETRGHVERLEQVFRVARPEGEGQAVRMGMEDILAEGTKLMGEDGDEADPRCGADHVGAARRALQDRRLRIADGVGKGSRLRRCDRIARRERTRREGGGPES